MAWYLAELSRRRHEDYLLSKQVPMRSSAQYAEDSNRVSCHDVPPIGYSAAISVFIARLARTISYDSTQNGADLATITGHKCRQSKFHVAISRQVVFEEGRLVFKQEGRQKYDRGRHLLLLEARVNSRCAQRGQLVNGLTQTYAAWRALIGEVPWYRAQ